MKYVEFRSGLELRAIGNRRLVGIAAPYDVEALIGPFREVFRRGCWAASLSSGADVVALQDHDVGRLLGRTSSKTLELADEVRGLAFTLSLPDTQAGRDVIALAERNDLGGVSVGMRVIDQAWPTRDRREIRSAELIELSIISTFPAYPSTTVALRARQLVLDPDESPPARRRMLDRL